MRLYHSNIPEAQVFRDGKQVAAVYCGDSDESYFPAQVGDEVKVGFDANLEEARKNGRIALVTEQDIRYGFMSHPARPGFYSHGSGCYVYHPIFLKPNKRLSFGSARYSMMTEIID